MISELSIEHTNDIYKSMPLLRARFYKSIRARARETRARARLYLLNRTRIHSMAGGVKHPPTTPRDGRGGFIFIK